MPTLTGQFKLFDQGPPAEVGNPYLPIVHFIKREALGPTILDLGGGCGAYAFEAAKLGYDVVVADTNEKALSKARAHGLQTRLVDSQEDIGYGVVDTVLCIEVLEHVPDPGKFLEMAIRSAKRRVLLTLPCTNDFSELFHMGLTYAHIAVSDHVNHFDDEDLISLLTSAGCRFRVEKGDYLFPGAAFDMIKRSVRNPLARLFLVLLKVMNKAGYVTAKIPSRYYVVIEKDTPVSS